MRGFLTIAAVMMVTGCQQAPKDVTADSAWVRLPTVAGNPGAAYFTLRGGSQDATLLSASAKFAVRTELHESMKGHSGMMTMAPIKDVPIPAGGTVAFAPGGKHVMLYDIAPTLKAGEEAPLTLTLSDGKTITVEAIVVGAGDPAPK